MRARVGVLATVFKKSILGTLSRKSALGVNFVVFRDTQGHKGTHHWFALVPLFHRAYRKKNATLKLRYITKVLILLAG
jgi:hypothetical protein